MDPWIPSAVSEAAQPTQPKCTHATRIIKAPLTLAKTRRGRSIRYEFNFIILLFTVYSRT